MTLRELQSTWENLGRTDPLWAVLTDEDRRDGRWDLDEFLATAAQPIQTLTQLLGKLDLALGDRVLDFGCGVGRLSNCLAEYASNVVGIDIAASMIDYANQINRHPDRLSFVHYDGRSLPFPDASFDSAVSLISLQHSRPPVQLAALLELRRVVRTGGVIVFQIPSQPRRPEPLAEHAMRADIKFLSCPETLRANDTADIRVRITNISNHRWPVGRLLRIGNHWLDAQGHLLVQDDGRVDLPHTVLPGETFEVELPITAPATPGLLRVEVDLVQEAVSWWHPFGSVVAQHAIEVTGRPPAPGSEDTPTRSNMPTAEASLESSPTAEAPTESSADALSVEYGGSAGKMEMHGLPGHLIQSLFSHCGCVVRAVVPDTMAGEEWESFTYVVQRET